jgi:SDR family mycofactocin-dependent oxidoreductase
MCDLTGKVALVTGAARGQGRAHAYKLADQGADVIVIDVCGPVASSFAPASSRSDLDETVKGVIGRGRRVSAHVADVRSSPALVAAVAAGVAELGRLDVVVANAGIISSAPALELTDEQWENTIDVNLTGVWRTVKAAVPHVLAGGRGGSVVLVSSNGGQRGFPNMAHYCASKHGVVGLMRVLAHELADARVRVNAICPGIVNTLMADNPRMVRRIRPDLAEPTWEDAAEVLRAGHLLPEPWIEPSDVGATVAWLASDEAWPITGTVVPVDMGGLAR